ncbi:MAG: hypothetical protein O4808_14845 [Trichodesmium sp. St17_bin3_1_1]|nr:hypothetical protein [Trichodesmium sp. St18_bin1]MDE5108279.1 hypothetical protein [Trichodesmium sp. St17_bin3_1_1]MDE5121816.1 hypothetical protein [Trichodesmium sp. St19_bin1]
MTFIHLLASETLEFLTNPKIAPTTPQIPDTKALLHPLSTLVRLQY